MSLGHGANIVRDGLVLHLDAASVKSYSGSGTTWKDVSGNGNDGTLVNGAAFDSNNQGSFSFDGVNDYVNAGDFTDFFPSGDQSHNLTVNVWWKGVNSTSENRLFAGSLVDSNNRLYLGRRDGYWEFGWGTQHWATSFTGNRILTTNNWTNIVFVVNAGVATLFVNGVVAQSRTDTAVSLSGMFPVGAYFHTGAYDVNSGSNLTSLFNLYNHALSEAEIKQNFNALRGRYGI